MDSVQCCQPTSLFDCWLLHTAPFRPRTSLLFGTLRTVLTSISEEMSAYTDPLQLNEIPVFRQLKNNMPKNVKDTRNIIEIRDNVIYAWDAMEFSLLTLNLGVYRNKNAKITGYQRLLLTDPPIYDVKNLLINETGTQLVMWSEMGISLVELPKRWGKHGLFQGGKDEILCVVYKLDHFDTSIEIRKARWHPGSTNDSHLLVLTSENTFCLYECEVGKSPKLVKSWKIGRTPLSSPSKIPDFTCLGEAAVDFDFVTPSLREPEMFSGKDIKNVAVDWSQIDWRILVLRGNGEVVIVYGNVLLDQYQSPVVTRTLSMHPPADDNYGIDSCSIMCIQTTPPIVVIATCTGKIYHAILLKNETSDENDVEKRNSSQSNSMYSVLSECPISDETLYVYECIEVGDFYGDTDKKLNFPINLHCDKINKYRYFCTHNHGLQMVTVPMVSELEDYLNISDDIADVCLPSPSNQSSSQHWICGRTKQRGTNDATPILGIGIFQEPYVLVALLHTGDVVSRSLIDLRYFPKIEPLEPVTNKEKKPTKEPFDVYIKKLLKCKTPEPNVDTRLRSMEVCLQESDDYLRKEFARHDHIHEEISKKVRALKIMKSHLLKQLDSLMETRKELQQTAERLAERYEDIKYAQEKLAQRSKEVLRLVNCKEPTITPIERAEAVKLRDMEIDVKKMGVRLKELRMKSDQLTQQIENNDMNERKKEIVFKGGQEGIIKNTLNNMGKDIKELIDELKELDEEVCNYTK